METNTKLMAAVEPRNSYMLRLELDHIVIRVIAISFETGYKKGVTYFTFLITTPTRWGHYYITLNMNFTEIIEAPYTIEQLIYEYFHIHDKEDIKKELLKYSNGVPDKDIVTITEFINNIVNN